MLIRVVIIFVFSIFIARSAPDSLIVEHQEKFYYEIQIVNAYSLYLDNKYEIKDKEYSPTFRFIWKPNHNLSLGVESGYVPILIEDFKKDNSKFEGKMYAIPILFNLTYDLYIAYLFAGFGPSLINSKITALNEVINSNIWAGTYNYGLGLKIPFSRNFSIGVEAQGFYFSKINKIVAQAGLNLTYGFYGY